MADTALNAIENNETYVMVVEQRGRCKTVGLSDFVAAGEMVADPHIPDMKTSNAYVDLDDPLLDTAFDMGIYIGEIK